MKRPEILAPCGNFEKLKFAILYGADAVYLAGKSFGMRTASDNFTDEELKTAIAYAHERNVKVYITVNVMPRQYELDAFASYLSYLSEIKPDALIIADLGVMALAKKLAPHIDIHISTQANTVNSLSCRVFHELGAKRIVLSRELSLDEIRRIRQDIPEDLELEAFVHGAMCVSHSGRCLLSNYFVGRDANHGACAQPCRWEYNGEGLSAEICEIKRPDIRLTALENDRGTFIFSSKDMCMIEHIPELVTSGIDSFKIEGRVKSAYYTAVTANAYKTELAKYLSSPKEYSFDGTALRELESVSHREYCTGYYFDHPLSNAQITQNGGYIKEKAFLATVEAFDKDTMRATLIQRNKAENGNEADIITPGGIAKSFVLEDMRDEHGDPIESAPHPQMRFSVKVPFAVNVGDIIRGK